MKQDPETADLTAHSFKRGALTFLAMLAVNGIFDLTLLPLIAKHKSAMDFPAMTLRYIGDQETEALLMRTHEVTIHIPCRPYLTPLTPTPAATLPPVPTPRMMPAPTSIRERVGLRRRRQLEEQRRLAAEQASRNQLDEL